LAPLPTTSVAAVAAHPRTQVLAQNARLEWSQNIGDDAELLALARAMGSAPGAGRRTVAVGLAVAVGLIVAVVALAGDEVAAVARRAFRGQPQELGTIVVKVRPAPDDVVLDGRSRGPGNKKIANVDLAEPHQLIVRPRGLDPLVRELTRADFADSVDGVPTFSLEKDLQAAPDAPPPP
jgi:hypothetical protein